MTPEPRSVEEALAKLADYVRLGGYEVITLNDGSRSAVPADDAAALAALALLRSELTRLQGIEEAARRAKLRYGGDAYEAAEALEDALDLNRLRRIEAVAHVAHDEPYDSGLWWRELGAALARPDRQEEGDG